MAAAMMRAAFAWHVAGDEKSPAAGIEERRDDMIDTDAIGIRLDYGGIFSRPGHGRKRLVVPAQRAQVDRQDAGCTAEIDLFRHFVVHHSALGSTA